ncbi:replication factor A protein 3 [Gigaspora margarita]|uniref:Replication factor A protein 3 n=1 Tax=Gigaspora margarita TaxID=4874 RepID=A0A8H4ATL6_GIGMA|nr:replication factor A protein 3 [Gigaspora margarita]
MSSENPRSPRINSALRVKYRGETVRLIGKVLEASSKTAKLEASDKGQVQVVLKPGLDEPLNPESYIEVIGRVNDDLSIKEYNHLAIREPFDLETYDLAVQLWQRYPNIF